MYTYAEGELNALTEMWMGSVHGTFFLCLIMEDIVVMFTAMSVYVTALVKKFI
jgi:hypothetical protein